MTPDPSHSMNTPNDDRPRLSLAEQLQRTLDEDEMLLEPTAPERERWDEDEGTFGG